MKRFGTLVLVGNLGPSDPLDSAWSSMPVALTAVPPLLHHPPHHHHQSKGDPDSPCPPPPHLDTDGVGLYGGSNTPITADMTPAPA